MSNVFVNGCFDVLHIGHLALFEYAKSLGTTLIVGIDSDLRISQSKGQNRPINNQVDRQRLLQSLKVVDKVYIFNTDIELENLIQTSAPDYMVVGSEYKNKNVIGSCYAKEIKFFDRISDYASSKTIQYIING
jgi:D-beta-D-heptose 7-phosphate kinase/D-beta-D-heptose 1-phosphate adenosyltransferase